MQFKPAWWVPALALAAGLWVQQSPLQGSFSQALTDRQLRLIAAADPAPGTLIFDIDDASLAELQPLLGPWPYKRDVYALVATALREAGATAVVLDLLLSDEREGDAALAKVIQGSGAPVLLAAAGSRYAPATERLTLASDPRLKPQTIELSHPGLASEALAAFSWPSITLPNQALLQATGGRPQVGLITTPVDADGRLRHLHLWHQSKGQRWPALPLAIWFATQPVSDPKEPPPLQRWPVDGEGRVTVAFTGERATVGQAAVQPFANLARAALGQSAPRALEEAARGKVVFIGSSALLADSVMTVSGQSSGTMVLAQAFTALRDGKLVRASDWIRQIALLLLAALPALLLAFRGKPAWARDCAAYALTAATLACAVLYALYAQQTTTALAAPLTVLAVGLVGAAWLAQRQQRRQRQELEYEYQVATAANQAKSAFLANVSHEIRTPMNALLGVAELLADSPLNPEQQRQVHLFRQAGAALQTLIDDLLDLAKMEASRFELDSVVFDLGELLDQAVAMTRPRAHAKGLQLYEERDAALPRSVLGDQKRLMQALLNLLGNAVKFTPSGHVVLSVTVDPVDPKRLIFNVRDTGIGIAADKLGVVFEPFAQADGTVTRHYGGTGLGLSISRRIARLMGGDLNASSTPGQGSVFTMTVQLPEVKVRVETSPLANASAAAPAEPKVPAPNPPVRPTVRRNENRTGVLRLLLAEDNEVNVYLFQAMLEGLPLLVDVATDGLQALQRLQEGPYDVAFFDVQMPGMDGLTLTRTWRQLEAQHGQTRMPVVALTANAFASDVQLSQEAGCDMHITKPFDRARLHDALRQLLGDGLLRKELGKAAD